MYAFLDRKEWELDLRMKPCPPPETIDPTLASAARSAARKTEGLKLALATMASTGSPRRRGHTKARASTLHAFSGIGNDYQPPTAGELTIDTSTRFVPEATDEIGRKIGHFVRRTRRPRRQDPSVSDRLLNGQNSATKGLLIFPALGLKGPRTRPFTGPFCRLYPLKTAACSGFS